MCKCKHVELMLKYELLQESGNACLGCMGDASLEVLGVIQQPTRRPLIYSWVLLTIQPYTKLANEYTYLNEFVFI